MVGATAERDAEPTNPHDGLDDADGDLAGLQDRPLLDVQLDIRPDVFGIPAGRWGLHGVQPVASHGVKDPCARRVAKIWDILRPEDPREGVAPEEAAEGPFLVSERDQLNGMAKLRRPPP